MLAGKRVAVAIAAMLGAAAASAADYRIGPAPAWVRPVAFDAAAHATSDAANVAFGARYDLIDDQVRLAPGSRTRFHHVVSEAVTAKGIDDLSHREVEVDPAWETLVISQLDVIRDGRRVSRLRDMQVKVLQRERDLESRIYDGRKMIALDLPDIRVGDIVEFAYTRSGMNPVFQGHHAGDFDMQWPVPVAHLHRRLSSAVGLNVQVAQLTGAAAPQAVAQADGFDERTWYLQNVPGLRVEASVPGNFNPYPWIEWSDFASWGEVARWAERLYPVPARLSPALQAAVDGIARQSPDADARIVAVLRLVQQQVRYLGVEIGAGTHAPSAPDVVYARRWGDCKEKSLLMVTMLRALGVDASPALVNTERRQDIVHDLPNAGSFDHAIVHVKFDGQDYWLDPTRAPQQGTLSTVSQPDYARALVLDGRSAALTAMRADTVDSACARGADRRRQPRRLRPAGEGRRAHHLPRLLGRHDARRAGRRRARGPAAPLPQLLRGQLRRHPRGGAVRGAGRPARQHRRRHRALRRQGLLARRRPGRAPGLAARARDRQRAARARGDDPHDAAVAARPAVGARGAARAAAAGLARPQAGAQRRQPGVQAGQVAHDTG
jgi:hypothetical protein